MWQKTNSHTLSSRVGKHTHTNQYIDILIHKEVGRDLTKCGARWYRHAIESSQHKVRRERDDSPSGRSDLGHF